MLAEGSSPHSCTQQWQEGDNIGAGRLETSSVPCLDLKLLDVSLFPAAVLSFCICARGVPAVPIGLPVMCVSASFSHCPILWGGLPWG